MEAINSPPSEENRSIAGACQFIDRQQSPDASNSLPILTLVFIAAAFTLILARVPFACALTLLGVLGAYCIFLVVRSNVLALRASAELRAYQSLEKAVSIIAPRSMFIGACGDQVALAAAKDRFRNVVVRFWSHDVPLEIVPITTPFEPVTLDESNTSLRDMAAQSERELSIGARIHNSVVATGGWTMLFLSSLGILPMGISAFSTGKWWSMYFVIVAIYLFAVALRLGLVNPRANRFLIPGGLMVRKKVRLPGSRLYIYRPAESLLWVRQKNRKYWVVTIANVTRRETFSATALETELLLRAWLSPLDPPPVEKLKDFE